MPLSRAGGQWARLKQAAVPRARIGNEAVEETNMRDDKTGANRATAWGAALVAVLVGAAPMARADDGYPREHVYDTTVGPDEALVNVVLANNRWPDCTTLESAIRDIFRLEGVGDKPDPDKAMALWKWYRILVSSTGGGYVYEGAAGQRLRPCFDPHKIFAVYGHHQCDGLSWAMVPLWRAAGYMAFDSATHGHTTAALRYRDRDGVMRYHGFDAQARAYWWDAQKKIVSTRTMPVMTANVYRHVLTPQRIHSLRTSLRVGESVERRWDNRGYVVPPGRPGQPIHPRYYAYKPGATKGVYAIAGEQVQTLVASTDPKVFRGQLHEDSENVTCSPPAKGQAALHPAKAGQPAVFVYRLAPPYVIVEAQLEATVLTGRADDLCRLSVSRDGRAWQTVYERSAPGPEDVKIELGRKARDQRRPDVYTAYDVRIRAEFKTAGNPRSVGLNRLRLTTHRECNKRTLPNLMPGENTFRLTAQRLAEGWALELQVDYELSGKALKQTHTVGRFPYFFRIDAPGVKLRTIGNYDQDFGNEAVRMLAYRMRLVPAGGAKLDASLPAKQAAGKFEQSFPHPADMTRRRNAKVPESDPMQTSGFFPQSRQKRPADERMRELIRIVRTAPDRAYKTWRAAQELGNYPCPEVVDALCKELPGANLDLTLFICKALAQIADPKAIEPLLAKWRLAPRYAPGARYIPDALAAIGDRRVVADLIAPLKRLRFDFRFHIAHALGILGGPQAEKALKELAKDDPFPAVREEAAAALKKLRGAAKSE